jgi:ectoine hydroxylase-related dioxygenase (phytanoyl-CoA dioxygenase family)
LSQAATARQFNHAEIAHYADEGFVIVRGVLTADEVRELEAEAVRLYESRDLIDANNIRCRWQNHFKTGECRFDCFDPVIDLSPACERVARSSRILRLVSQIYGEQACLFKDKLIFKPPGAEGYALHQDYIAWKSFPKTFLTAIVAIDPCDSENGATEVFRGYHRRGYMSETDGMYHQLPHDAVDPSLGVVLALAPGDVAFFSGYTPHRSAPNASDRTRRLLYLSYNAFSDGGEQRERHYAEFSEWLKDRYAEYGKTMTYFR